MDSQLLQKFWAIGFHQGTTTRLEREQTLPSQMTWTYLVWERRERHRCGCFKMAARRRRILVCEISSYVTTICCDSILQICVHSVLTLFFPAAPVFLNREPRGSSAAAQSSRAPQYDCTISSTRSGLEESNRNERSTRVTSQ